MGYLRRLTPDYLIDRMSLFFSLLPNKDSETLPNHKKKCVSTLRCSKFILKVTFIYLIYTGRRLFTQCDGLLYLRHWAEVCDSNRQSGSYRLLQSF